MAVHELPRGLGRGDVPPDPVRQVHRVLALRVPLELLLPQQVTLGDDASHPALRVSTGTTPICRGKDSR
jgi:hypothetical protein